MKTTLKAMAAIFAICIAGAILPAAADVLVPILSVKEHVNIRMEADPKSEVIGHLRQGESAPYQRTIPGWHAVGLADGAYGYVSSDWSEVLTDDEFAARLANAQATADATPAVVLKTAADDVSSAAVDQSDAGTAMVSEPPEPAVAATAVKAAEITDVAIVDETASAVAKSETAKTADVVEAATVADKPTPNSPATETADKNVVAASSDNVIDQVPTQDVESELTGDKTPAINTPQADDSQSVVVPVVVAGPPGPTGPQGPAGLASTVNIKGTADYLVKFTALNTGGNSQIFDDGRNVGIGTSNPQQRLEVNGNIQINESNSNVAGLMITQASGDTGYIMHNRANSLTIGAGSVDRITIDRNGFVGIGTARPSNPLEMASGAYVSAGGVWTNSSSRERKENIESLSTDDALSALTALEPVRFNYKQEKQEEYIGFIAEDVPDLVATGDRHSLSTMDIVAVLTRVVQQQQRKIEELEARMDADAAR